MSKSTRTAMPFGDIYQVGTPYLDQLSNQLYVEQRQRELEQQKENAALDDQFSRNLASVRTADVGDISKAYNDWKQARLSTMNQHRLTPQEQLGVLQKKANLYKLINGSKQQMQVESETRKGLMSKPDSYADNARQVLGQSIQTPLTQLGDLANHDYSYQGTNTDFGSIFKNAQGQLKTSYQQQTPLDKSGEQTQITPYQYGNTPLQYHDAVIASLSKHQAGRDASAIVDSWSPETIAQVQDKYNSIPTSQWQQIGVDKPQDLTITPNDSKAEIFAKHNAQLYALNNEPKQGKVYTIDNKAIARQQSLADAKNKADYNDTLIRGRMGYAKQLQQQAFDYKQSKTSTDQDNALGKFINTSYDNGSNNFDGTSVDHMTIGGKNYEGKFIDIPESVKADFAVPETKDGKVVMNGTSPSYKYPDAIYLTKDKQMVIPVFKTGANTQTGGRYLAPESKPMPIQNFKIPLGKLLLTKSKMANEITNGTQDEIPKTEDNPLGIKLK